jgi:hypothetical protein
MVTEKFIAVTILSLFLVIYSLNPSIKFEQNNIINLAREQSEFKHKDFLNLF